MQFYYWDSPHRQITEDFTAKVVKVIDGDTIRVEWNERDFDFPVRLLNIAAPELDERGGLRAKKFMDQILGEEVQILINPRLRVEKWGRLLGEIIHLGINMGQSSMDFGYSVEFV